MVLAIIDSRTGPLESLSRWISSIITSFTSYTNSLSPVFLVIISHFYGVEMMT
jgi:hypothetical protein